jgi:predicted transglutaminase-like cysteine proteinase
MQNMTRLGLITFASIMMMAGPAGATGVAIAEDPEFRAAWAAYVAITPEASNHQRHHSFYAIAPVLLMVPVDMPSTSFARHIAATSPQEITEAVLARVRYTPDAYDYWQTGEQTWNRKAGDCEDFAALVRDICLIRGFDAQVVVFHAKRSHAAHAVVIGNHNGTIWMSSNGDYRVVESIADARDIMISELKWYHDEVWAYRDSVQETVLLKLLEV